MIIPPNFKVMPFGHPQPHERKMPPKAPFDLPHPDGRKKRPKRKKNKMIPKNKIPHHIPPKMFKLPPGVKKLPPGFKIMPMPKRNHKGFKYKQ
jgi:hypothetical protein